MNDPFRSTKRGLALLALGGALSLLSQPCEALPAPWAPGPPQSPSASPPKAKPGSPSHPEPTVEPRGAGQQKPSFTGVPQPASTPTPGRRRPTTPAAPTPGVPVPGETPPSPRPPGGELLGPRGWESWWELHRDRYLRLEGADLSLKVGLVPAEPRTVVQVQQERAAAFERIEPSLRLLLDHERSDIVLGRALIAMAKIGENPRIQGSRTTYSAILPYVFHEDAQVSEAAITALGILGTEDALFPLCEIAGVAPAAGTKRTATAKAPDRERALALYSMGIIGRDSKREDVRRFAASRICSLFAADLDASAEVKFAALHALSLLPVASEGEPAGKSARARAQRRPDRSGSRASPMPIPAASRTAEIDWVLAVLDDPGEEHWIRAQAVTAAARLCVGLPEDSALEARVVARLLEILAPRTEDAIELRQSAALALGELGDADNDALDASMRSALALAQGRASDQSTREFAVLSLAIVGSRPGGPAGDASRLSASNDVRRLLLHGLSSARSTQLPWTILALGVFEHGMERSGMGSARESRMALTDLLVETRSSEIAAVCCLGLGLSGAKEGVRELTSRLRDGDPDVRGYAALALGMIGARESAAGIERVLEQAHAAPQLYRPASDALALLGAPVGRQLQSLLSGGGASLESQMNLCAALGRVGDGRCVKSLVDVARDQHSLVWVRAAATSALGNLGSRRRDPWQADLGHALNFHAVPPSLRSTSLDGLLDLD